MTTIERYELIQQIKALPVVEQLAVLEEIIRTVRRSFVDQATLDRQVVEMANDPDIQRAFVEPVTWAPSEKS